MPSKVLMRSLGRRDYSDVWQAMKDFTDSRQSETPDEFWMVEHPPVFTLGQAGRPEHILQAGDIPVIKCDRGGQVTYHGPGQIVVYTLVNLRRIPIGVRRLVDCLEQSVIDFLGTCGVSAQNRADAPGVYVEGRKIAALGLRVRKGCSYHGLSFNVNLDVSPFERINPCGFKDLEVTRLIDCGVDTDMWHAGQIICERLAQTLGYSTVEYVKNDGNHTL